PVRKTIAELLHELGDIPAHRVRAHPAPGTATEADAIFATNTQRPCELVNGILVEKAMGVPESFLASLVLQYIGPYVRINKLGITTAPDGMYRMLQGNIREPDVSFTARSRKQGGGQVGDWCPDLCVEIVSPSNTVAELDLKRGEYFSSGCRLVWIIDPRKRSVEVFTETDTATRLIEPALLEGGTVLPGFSLPLAELFGAFDEGMQTTS
ncbi:MAG TPA: Uma2 family endonuclease, partial [Urbifossiella sp.]|nr:Uma2 family endonuclease [Urbifossiella sp.]